MTLTTVRAAALLLALTLVLAACGQHPGVHVEGGQAAGDDGLQDPADPNANAAPGAETGQTGAAEAPALDGGDQDLAVEEPRDAGSDDGDAPQSNEDDASAAPQAGGQAPEQEEEGGAETQAATREPQGQDRTGVDDDMLRLAVHAPVTGAAPLPSQAFEEAGNLYWRWVTEEQGEQVLGRSNIEVEFADDRFEPATARQVCRELGDRNFLVVGGGGTDQIQACGQLAAQTNTPYFSPGVTEAGLEGNPWYFPASMTYRQQGGLLAQLVSSRFGDATTGAIVLQTPNFDDAVVGWEQGVQAEGIDYAETLRNPRGQTGWYADFANRLADQDVEVVYVNMSPLDYIRFAQVAEDQGHDFQFVGVGVTMGLNPVLDNGCPEVDGGIFFSPFPSLDVVDDLDPEFRQAADRFSVEASDLALAIWGLQKTQHELFTRYEETFGTDLTREDFRALVSETGEVATGVFPPVNYQPDVDFGGQAVHVLEADCSTQTHRDAGTNQSGF
jgi:ABC-type branched-subunit amino acid transport system substrate-binding protein